MPFHSSLHEYNGYNSFTQSLLKQNLGKVIILRLGGSDPYIKFGELDYFDYNNFYISENAKKLEELVWISLPEEGKLLLPLKYIKLIYYDNDNNIINESILFEHCAYHGCMTVIDTKAYYTYGPRSQIDVLLFLLI